MGCLRIRSDLLDAAIGAEVLKILLELALAALQEMEARDSAILRQWQMRLVRTQLNAALAERRYQEIDPTLRMVAAPLEQHWNASVVELEKLKQQYAEFARQEARVAAAWPAYTLATGCIVRPRLPSTAVLLLSFSQPSPYSPQRPSQTPANSVRLLLFWLQFPAWALHRLTSRLNVLRVVQCSLPSVRARSGSPPCP